MNRIHKAVVSWLCLSATLLLVGCSGSAPITAGPNDHIGPHQGTLIALPGDKGYAEVFNPPITKSAVGRSAPPPTEIVVCFLDSTLKAPSAITATNVIVKLTIVTDHAETVELNPAPETSDPVGKNRFMSKKGQYFLTLGHVELNANIDGQPFRAEFDSDGR